MFKFNIFTFVFGMGMIFTVFALAEVVNAPTVFFIYHLLTTAAIMIWAGWIAANHTEDIRPLSHYRLSWLFVVFCSFGAINSLITGSTLFLVLNVFFVWLNYRDIKRYKAL